MDLNFNSKLEEYYQKFIELQEKLKNSEEQRFLMEMKFTEMVQVAKDEEQAHYRKLRTQYKRFLDEDQKRQDRNERIIRNLERIEAKISMLSAKTERISIFRRQYQKYLQRIASSNPEKKISDSRISRERSFIKEEPLKEQQQRLFRDDYSLLERPKGTLDKDKPIYENPAVKKSLEKDRSNEEKIEILDRYLQSISSQKCRDVLNQERQAKEKLSLDTPLDKLFKDDFTSNSTNHATAVAEDIMNSIYSRYYTKAEVTPKGSKGDLQKEMKNESKDNHHNEKSDYAEKEFKPDDRNYLDSLFSKNTAEKTKPTVNFNERVNVLQVEDGARNNKEALEKIPDHFTSKPVDPYYFQDQSKNNLPANIAQDILKPVSGYDNKSYINDNKNNRDEYKMTKDFETDRTRDKKPITSFGTKETENKNKPENAINAVRKFDNNITSNNELTIVDTINDNPNKYFEENKNILPYDPSGIVENSVPQTMPSKDQNIRTIVKEEQLQNEDRLKHQSQEQIPMYDTNNHVNKYFEENKNILPYDPSGIVENSVPQTMLSKDQNIRTIVKEDQPQSEDRLKQQSQKQIPMYVTNNHVNQNVAQLEVDNQVKHQSQPIDSDPSFKIEPTEETYSQPQPQQFNQPNENGQYMQADDQNLNSPSVDLDITQHNQDMNYNNKDESSIQYDETKKSMPYDPNTEYPDYAQNQPGENAQYNPPEQSLTQFKEIAAQPIQLDETGQPIEYAQNDPSYQQIQYNENEQPIEYNENIQPIQYDESGQPIQYNESGQPIQYDQNSQPIGYDQYGQPLMYDQNGQIVQPQYDENGQFIPQYDENGQMLMLYDQNGQQLFDDQYKGNQQQYDINGQPLGQYDENGQPIYDQNQQQYYDYTSQEQAEPTNGYNQYQGDGQVPYVEPQESQIQDHIEDTGNQLQTEEGNYYQGDGQEPLPMTEMGQIVEGDQYQTSAEYKSQENTEGMPDVINKSEENKEETEENKEIAKPTNVMDILDTDTESAKQNTSKISNESDFDFS